MDNYPVLQGTALPIEATIKDSYGDPITSYSGSEALTCRVWPGGNLPTSFTPPVSWISPGAGSFLIQISASETLAVSEGRYRGTVGLLDPVDGLIEAYKFSVDVQLGPGTGTLPRSYVNLSDLMEYASGWLPKLMTDADEAGFAKQCGRATSWLDDLIIAAWQTSNYLTLGDPGYGAVMVGQGNGQLPSVWLRQQLDAGALILRDLVKEIVANRALGIICRGKITVGDKAQDWRKLGRFYIGESEELAKTLRAEIDTNGDGVAELAVNLGVGSMR